MMINDKWFDKTDKIFDKLLTPKTFWTAFVVIATLIAVSVVASTALSYSNHTTHTGCVVDSKENFSVSDGDGAAHTVYRVYTENCGVFEVQDLLFIGNIRTADLYGSIKEGATYDFETRGYRVPLLSTFPVIVKVSNS